MNGRYSRYVITAALSASLVVAGSPAIALGETSDQLQSQLSAAQERLSELYSQAEVASESLNEANYQLGETKSRIEENTKVAAEKEVELAEESETLSGIVADDYKNGSVSLASIILGSHSIPEMVSTVYSLNKVSERQQRVIASVKQTREELATARASLETDKQLQEELVSQREESAAALQTSVNQSQNYVNGLSAEVQQALQREEAERQAAARAEAERQAAAIQAQAQREEQERAAQQQQSAQAQQQPAQAQQQPEQQAPQPEQQPAPQPEQQPAPQPEQQPAPQPEQQPAPQPEQQPEQQPEPEPEHSNENQGSYNEYNEPESSENNGGQEEYSASPDSSVAATVVAAALSQVGVDYVYGTCNPGVSFDCSGLTMYAYQCAGISIPHSSESQSVWCNKPASQAVAGDIVWRSGHVGICIGDGKTVEAFMPGMGVGIGSVSSFVSAGSPA